MNGDNLEGQISFLGLLEGYTDTLEEVRKPAPPKRVKPVLPKAPEQFKLEFIDLDAEAEAEHLEVEAPANAETPAKAATSVVTETPVVEQKLAEAQQPSGEKKQKALAESQESATAQQPVVEMPLAKDKAPVASKAVLWPECKKCWCQDCKHNSRGEGVPREMCGAMIACPACDLCVSEDKATICEIGNATEGCKLRAIEDGLVEVEEETIG